MFITVDSTDGVPLYLQIAREIKHSIAVGALRSGEQLPSVREVALQITVNPNTVAKAYRELETRGIVETRRGTGTFVAEETAPISAEERRRVLGRMIDKVLDEGRHLKMSEGEVMRLFFDRITTFKEESEKTKETRDD